MKLNRKKIKRNSETRSSNKCS